MEKILSLPHKPPITILLILINLSIYALPLLKSKIPLLSPLISQLQPWTVAHRVCLQPYAVLSGDTWRLLLPAFIHGSDLHVLYNCTSLLYKGVTLESELGSVHFLALILYLAVTSNVLYVIVAVSAASLGYKAMMSNCVVGFSAVIFGLKVVVNSSQRYTVSAQRIFGLSMPGGVSPWAELVLASVMMPNVSFLGHLCGILAGLLYLYLPKLARPLWQRLNRGPERYARIAYPDRYPRLHAD